MFRSIWISDVEIRILTSPLIVVAISILLLLWSYRLILLINAIVLFFFFVFNLIRFSDRHGYSTITCFGYPWYSCCKAKRLPTKDFIPGVFETVKKSFCFFFFPKIFHFKLFIFLSTPLSLSYKFLAFDFDENVDMTKDNCRLLLIRLKMEGWIIGKTKVFLKYYNVEYLSRWEIFFKCSIDSKYMFSIVNVDCMRLKWRKLSKCNRWWELFLQKGTWLQKY